MMNKQVTQKPTITAPVQYKTTFHRSLPFGLLKMFLKLAVATSLVTLSLSATYNTVENLSAVQWDFIIVGGILPVLLVKMLQYADTFLPGGTAGSVLASRLTENPRFNVLVLEAGPT